MKRLLALLFLLPVIPEVHASERPTLQVDLSILTNPTTDFKTLVIPIKRVKNLIVIEARIDTLIGNFILDTGSPGLILNKTYFRGAWSTDQYASNATGRSNAVITKRDVTRLTLKELVFENLTADLSDLGHIENFRDIKILGLLGVSLFSSYEMIIDLHKEVLYLRKPDPWTKESEKDKILKSEPLMKVPFQMMRNIITVEVTVKEKKLIFCLDTGAETNALSNMLSGKVLQSFHVTKRMVLLGTGGSQAEVLLGTLDEFWIGAKSFKNMHTAITNLQELGDAYGRSIDGILGNNFLVKGIISINFVTKELSMYPYDVSNP